MKKKILGLLHYLAFLGIRVWAAFLGIKGMCSLNGYVCCLKSFYIIACVVSILPYLNKLIFKMAFFTLWTSWELGYGQPSWESGVYAALLVINIFGMHIIVTINTI